MNSRTQLDAGETAESIGHVRKYSFARRAKIERYQLSTDSHNYRHDFKLDMLTTANRYTTTPLCDGGDIHCISGSEFQSVMCRGKNGTLREILSGLDIVD